MDEREAEAIEEAIKQLRERIIELRQLASAGNLTDQIVDIAGDLCAIAGLLLLLVFPTDLFSATLSVLGIAIVGYNHLLRLPHARDQQTERRRQIDMLTARIDRMERELVDGADRS